MAAEPRIFLAMPILRDMHGIVFETILKFAQPYVTHVHTEIGYSETIDVKRNKCVRRMLAETDCTHMLFWDSDTVGEPGAILQLLKANVPVIAATIYRKGGEHAPVFGYWDEANRLYRVPVPFDYNKVMKVDIVGTGFMLVKREVFEQLEDPWFESYEKGNAWEDIDFCLKCKEADIGVYIHTGVHLGHIATPYLVTNETYEMNALWRITKRARDLGKLPELKAALYKILEQPVDVMDTVDRARPRLRTSAAPNKWTDPIKVDTLVVGIDGLDGRACEILDIPVLDKLGQYGVMESIPPFHTGPCWMSMYTGVMPNDHGLTKGGWEAGKPYTQIVKVPTLWQQIPGMGALNMPVTWPVFEVDGWMVSGFPCNERADGLPIAYPPKVREYLPDDYVSDVTSWGLIDHEMPAELKEQNQAEWVRKLALSRFIQFRRIHQDYTTKHAAIGFTFPDRYGHMGEYDLTWQVLDEVLQMVLANFNYKKLIIMSDHGFDGNVHSSNAFYLTNFGAHPRHLTDMYQVIVDACGGIQSPWKHAYEMYTKEVSTPVWAISWELANWLINYLNTNKPERILDLGSGLSSYLFRKYAPDAEVISVDMDPEWLKKTAGFLQEHDLPLTGLITWEDFKFTEGEEFDLILHDIGIAEKDRSVLLETIREFCRGVLILDDMHIKQYRDQALEVFGDDTIINLMNETKDQYGRYAWMVVPKG